MVCIPFESCERQSQWNVGMPLKATSCATFLCKPNSEQAPSHASCKLRAGPPQPALIAGQMD
eukprot:4826023-Pyramimonas_sp.AAC.1